jgi:excisionase family DNA binding protein
VSTPEAISQRDAAAELGISRATVERWVNQGRLNTVRTGERGGARRVLVDEIFHAAKNASRKTPHQARRSTRKSLTAQKPSARESEQSPHAAPPSSSGDPATETLARSADMTHLDAPATSVLPESLAPDMPESLTHRIEESLAHASAGALADAPPAVPRSERMRHPLDADLVPLTSAISLDAGPRGVVRRRRARARSAVAILVIAVFAAAVLAISAPWHQARRAETAPTRQSAGARGAHAQATASARHRAAAAPTRQPRGGHARRIVARTTAAPAKSITPATPSPGVPASGVQTTTSSADRQQRQHPITPCQSSGICVPD